MDEMWVAGVRATGTVHDVDRHGLAVDFPTHGDDGDPDAYGSAWNPHVFQASFRRFPTPPVVFDHRRGEENVIGRTVRAESLPDRARLVGTFEDFGRRPMAERAYREIQSGLLPGYSFEFREGKWRPHGRVRSWMARALGRQVDPITYTSATMAHWGPVYQPAIAGTTLVGIRSAPSQVQRLLLRSDRRSAAVLDAVRAFAAAGGRDEVLDLLAAGDFGAGGDDFALLVDRVDRVLDRICERSR